MVDLEELHELRHVTALDVVNTSLLFFKKYHKSTKDRSMSFKDMPYLYELYLDTSQKIAVMSSVQTGKSEWALIRGIACMDIGLNVFHVFSTGEAKNSFVKSRIDGLFDKVPEYKKLERDNRPNRYLRAIGNANWKFVISNSESHFDEFPADVGIVDEYDSCNEDNIGLLDSRLEDSNYKFKWFVGNPTVANYGIENFYKKSSRKRWHFKCPHCGEYYIADFMRSVVNEVVDRDNNHLDFELHDDEWKPGCGRDIKLKCLKCGELHQRPKAGKWVKMNPEAVGWSGYQISQLMKLNKPVLEIWETLKESEGNDRKMQIFYNKQLGLPYEGVGAKVTIEMLDRLKYGYYTKEKSSKKTVAGMDVGDKFDIHIDISAKHDGKRKKLMLNAFSCGTLNEIKELVDLFNIKMMCVGVKPERHLMKNFQEDMFGICDVWLVEELKGRGGQLKTIGFKEDEDEQVITVDRTWMLDESMKNIRKKYNILPKNYDSILDGFWVESMTSITRILETGENEYKWSKAEQDHFRFAEAFSMLAWMKTQDAILIGNTLDDTEEDKKKDKYATQRGKKGKKSFREDSIGIIKRRMGLARSTGFRRRDR